MNFYAYIYRGPSRDNEPIYVGKGKGSRAYNHLLRKDKHPFTHRLRFMKALGVEPHIEIIEALDENHAFFLESCLIRMFGRKDLGLGSLFNLTDGGEGASGIKQSPETIEKKAVVHRGAKRSIISCIRIAIANQGKNLGRVQPQEERAKRSASQTGIKRSPESVAKSVTARTGKKRTPEMIARMTAARWGNE